MAISSTTSASAAGTGTSFNVDGVVSGLNTTALITQLMTLSQAPLNQLTAQQTQVKARDTAYQAISSQLITFQGSVQNLLVSTAINAKISASTVPTVATATADSTAINGNFSITVANLATATAVTSNARLGSPANLDPTTILSAAGMSVPVTAGNFTLNGKTIAVTTGEPWSQLQSDISTATGGAVTLNLNQPQSNSLSLTSSSPIQLGSPADTSNFLSAAQLLNAAQIPTAYTTASTGAIGTPADMTATTLVTSANLSTPLTPGGGTFSINGHPVVLDGTESWQAVQSKISTATGGAVSLILGANGVSLSSSSPVTLGASDTSNFLAATKLTTATQTTSGYGVASTQLLGEAQVNNTLASAGLGTPLTATSGSFAINGVSISWAGTDSISNILTRINSSAAGVTATYDPKLDKVSLTNTGTGAQSISLVDAPGTNLLQALNLTGAPQVAGAAAQYTTTQNGVTSATQYSNSNIITGAEQGINVTLLSAGTTSLSTTQDTDTATKNIQAFITQFNSMVDSLDAATAISTSGATGILAGDSTITGLADQLRSIVTEAAVVPAGSVYATMGDIGISTGPYGSVAGTTNHLVLDAGKLATALTNNPQAVMQMMSGLSGSTSLGGDPSTTALLQTATGSPYGQVTGGSYKVTFAPATVNLLDATKNTAATMTSVFTSTDGTISPATSTTVADGGTYTSLIPGVFIVAQNPLPASATTATINYTVSGRGILQTLNDYVNQSRGPNGIFTSESADATSTESNLTTQIANQNTILAQRKLTLQAQFTAMEVALASLQSQGAALSSSLGVAAPAAAAPTPSASA